MRRLKRVLYSLIDCEHKTAPAIDVSSYRVVRTSGGTRRHPFALGYVLHVRRGVRRVDEEGKP